MHATFGLGNLKERRLLRILGVDRKTVLNCVLKKFARVWAGFNWLRIGTSGWLL
jgi:hypothetical protein